MRTNIGLKLKFGKEERVFRLEFISNQRISPQEFTKWKEACTEANISLPTIGKISYYSIFDREDALAHTVAIWTFTFHKKSGFVKVILKANFKPA